MFTLQYIPAIARIRVRVDCHKMRKVHREIRAITLKRKQLSVKFCPVLLSGLLTEELACKIAVIIDLLRFVFEKISVREIRSL